MQLVGDAGKLEPEKYVMVTAVNVGDTWSGAIAQTPELEKMLSDGFLYCGIRNETTGSSTFTQITPKK